ncbi:MAG: exodeoxyribonuclease VII large subunit [Bacteroidales bacterium]|jgi:exodeoxyribonuclease VII large subunit|nr:exodeoxyribonuclease VII large subunit [Bacteroidales bacterium]
MNMPAPQYTLSELNIRIQESIQGSFPALVWVKAEISEYREHSSGHCYLDLIETRQSGGEVIARTRATIWSYTFRLLKTHFETATGQALRNGLGVMVQVKVEFHPVYGMSLNIKDIDPAYTVGDMAMRRREIINRLQQEGILNLNRQLPLPVVPQRIAVISSATAAGYNDFVNHLKHNGTRYRLTVTLFPASMQGADTGDSVISAMNAIRTRQSEFDIAVIIRGGGAHIELAAFDNYALATAVARFPLPVITGIGHDRDETVADLVAHTKLKTPTAVAEFLLNGCANFAQRLNDAEQQCTNLLNAMLRTENQRIIDYGDRLKNSVRQRITGETHRFAMFNMRLQKTLPLFVRRHQNQLEQVAHYVQQKTGATIQTQLLQLAHKTEMAPKLIKAAFNSQRRKIQAAEEKCTLVDPANVLKRGYSLTLSNGCLLRSVSQLADGMTLTTRLADGAVTSIINSITEQK